MLKLNGVSAHYGDVQALRGVTCQVKEGEIVSIIGSNGAGKSTTLSTISGILPASSGRIEFLGRRIENLSPHEIVNEGVVQIPEGRRVFPFMSVMENLELGCYPKKPRAKKKGSTASSLRMLVRATPSGIASGSYTQKPPASVRG